MKAWIPLALLLLTGCVDRLISVRSDPPGAAVLLDGDPAGVTPVDIPYSWYGTRDLTLEMRGYQSVTRRLELRPPWWQWFPLDFITDLLLPFVLTDRVELEVKLEPEPAGRANADELKARAAELEKKVK